MRVCARAFGARVLVRLCERERKREREDVRKRGCKLSQRFVQFCRTTICRKLQPMTTSAPSQRQIP